MRPGIIWYYAIISNNTYPQEGNLILRTSPLMDCHLAVVEGLVCLRDPANSAGRGLASGRCNQAGKINGERPDKRAARKKDHCLKHFLKFVSWNNSLGLKLRRGLAVYCSTVFLKATHFIVRQSEPIFLTKSFSPFFFCSYSFFVHYRFFLKYRHHKRARQLHEK